MSYCIFGYSRLLLGSVLALSLTGCTTSNQESLGVGVSPSSNNVNATVASDANSSTSTKTALATDGETLTPSQAAVLGVTSPENSNDGSPNIAKVGFLPVTGAPQKAVLSLSRALGGLSNRYKVGVVGKGDRSAEYQLKGYMSALNEGSRTTVTFYWDVLDKSGRRLYRINGFEQESGAKANPWDGVSDVTMQKIANRTLGSFAGWVKRKGA